MVRAWQVAGQEGRHVAQPAAGFDGVDHVAQGFGVDPCAGGLWKAGMVREDDGGEGPNGGAGERCGRCDRSKPDVADGNSGGEREDL